MFVPAHFRGTDLTVLDQLLARDPFVTLITTDNEGAPFASHAPVLWQRDGAKVELRGHVARANPQWQHRGPALAVVHGPHAYISPCWYADTESASRVPTWNYVIAHLRGTPDWQHDADDLAALVSELSARFEGDAEGAWRFQPERESHRNDLRGIVGFHLVVQHIDLKLKLNQNHPPANIRGAADGLRAQARADSDEIATWMLQAAGEQP